MNNIRISFINDFQINHQLKILDTIGVEIKFNFQYINKEVIIKLSNIRFSDTFIKAKKLINHPKINFSGFTISSIELFKFQIPNKEVLTKSLLENGLSLKQSNSEKIVNNLYAQSLQRVEQEQKYLTNQFQSIINQNLIFLEESISNFCLLYNRSLK